MNFDLQKGSGFYLRKDDPAALSNQITAIHNKGRDVEQSGKELPSRMKFMLEVLTAVRNNNVRRVPGADIERTDRLKKLVGLCIRGMNIFTTLASLCIQGIYIFKSY